MAAEESRIERIEKQIEAQDRRYSETTRIIFDKIDSLATTMIDVKSSLAHAPKPAQSWKTIATVAASSTIIGAAMTWLGFFVDARINAKTERAVVFAEDMTKEGKLYVDLALIKRDLKELQDAVAWKPALVEASKR